MLVDAERGVGMEEVEEGLVEEVRVRRCFLGVRLGDRRLERRKAGERVAGSRVRREEDAMGVWDRAKEKAEEE